MIDRSFLKSEFSRNTLMLMTGTLIAQAIPFVLQIFLRRMYLPEDFGAWTVYLTLMGIATIVSALRYDSAILLPETDNDAANAFSLAVFFNLCFGTVLLIVILLFPDAPASLIGLSENYSGILYLLPFGCMAFGIFQSMNYWLIRKKSFVAVSANKIARRVAEGMVQLGCGLKHFHNGLIYGDLAGHSANVVAGAIQLHLRGWRLSMVSVTAMKAVFFRYIHLPKFNVIPTLFSSAASVLPFLIVNKFYSTEMVGFLDLTRMVLSIPVVLVSSAVSQVFYQHCVECKNRSQSLWPVFNNMLKVLLLIIGIEAIVLIPFGPSLFGWIFGEIYSVSGSFSRVLFISFSFNLIASCFSSVFLTFGKIKINSVWQTAYFISACSLVLFTRLPVSGFLVAWAAIESLMLGIYFYMIVRIIRNHEKGIIAG